MHLNPFKNCFRAFMPHRNLKRELLSSTVRSLIHGCIRGCYLQANLHARRFSKRGVASRRRSSRIDILRRNTTPCMLSKQLSNAINDPLGFRSTFDQSFSPFSLSLSLIHSLSFSLVETSRLLLLLLRR